MTYLLVVKHNINFTNSETSFSMHSKFLNLQRNKGLIIRQYKVIETTKRKQNEKHCPIF